MIARIVRALVDAGATPQMIAAAVDAYNEHTAECYADEERRVEERRTKDREKKREQRLKAKLSPNVPRTTGDGEGQPGTTGDKPLKEIPPVPPKENTPPSSVSNETGAAAPPNPEKDLFDRGKAVLGSRAGGVVRKLLDAKGGSVALARAAIEQASTKSSPAEYIGAILRKPEPEKPKVLVGL